MGRRVRSKGKQSFFTGNWKGGGQSSSPATQMGAYLCGSVPLHQAGETLCECVIQVSVKGTGAGVRMDKARLVHKGLPNQAKGQCGLRDRLHTGGHLGRGGKGVPGLERPLPLPYFAKCSTSESSHSADITHSLSL